MRQIFLILIVFCPFNLFAQTFNSKLSVTEQVFENLVNAYGSSKSAPALKILPVTAQKIVAQYVVYPSATIQIDEDLYDICRSFGKDSANALAIILSHELAHYYNDHNWCSDYAFALRNSTLGKTLIKVSKETKIEKESIADSYGLFYACIAGYQPFEIFNPLLDKIYKHYKLPEIIQGYPTKKERKEINRVQKDKIEKLIPVFDAGVILTYAGKYEDAINCFNYLNKFFPSRENYNNLGTARLLWAIKLKPQQSIEFIYPVEIDPFSRLNSTGTRSYGKDEQSQMYTLLQSAKKDFEKAISLDPIYTKTYINLACVYDLMDNYDAAIGQIKDMPSNDAEAVPALEIKAIAYAHADNVLKAEECFLETQELTNNINRYNYKVFTLGSQSLLASEKFKEQWSNQSSIDSAQSVKIVNEIKRINTINAKATSNEVITQINEHTLLSIKSKITPNVKELFIQKQGSNIRIREYLSLNKSIQNNSYQNWIIIKKEPMVILQKVKGYNNIITIN